MFWTIPIKLMKTINEVLPALINGSGKPVGGTSPVTTAMFNITWIMISAPIPVASKKPNLSGAFLATFIIHKNIKTNKIIIKSEPAKPVSSAITENIKSDSANGKNKYFCLELNIPEPNIPPREIPRSDCTSWNPSSCFAANGSAKAISLFSLYGSIKINKTTSATAGTESIAKCFNLAPPTKSITTTKSAMQMVIDMFGSKIIKTQ